MMDEKLFDVLMQRLDRIEDKIDNNFKETEESIDEIKEDVRKLKTKFAIIAITFGLAGGKISSLLPFLK
jgi:tetrahydromethanopterin S-methyltransferase subunit G